MGGYSDYPLWAQPLPNEEEVTTVWQVAGVPDRNTKKERIKERIKAGVPLPELDPWELEELYGDREPYDEIGSAEAFFQRIKKEDK